MSLTLTSVPMLLVPLAIPAVLVYFFQVRPTRRQARALIALHQGLREGDRVATRGGLHATVTALGGDTVDLEVRPGEIHRYDRDCVARRLSVA